MARYIDAELFLRNETKRCSSVPLIGTCTTDNESLAYQLAKAPIADVVEVKHGEWDVNVGMNFNKERICPICKKRIESNYWEFCSHCGAKMDGRRDT